MKKQIKLLSVLALGMGMSMAADAQVVYPYTMNVDNGVRTGSNGYVADTFTENGVKWYINQTFIGNDVNDVKIGTKSLRMRPNAGNVLQSVTELPQGIDVIQFVIARANFNNDRTGNAPKVAVGYSINQGTSWIDIDTIDLSTNVSLEQYTSNSLNISSPALIRIHAIAGDDGKRFNIDSLIVTPAVAASNIVLMSMNPTGTVHPNNVDKLVLKFNDAIDLGTGNIVLQEVGGAAQTYDVATSSDVNVTDSTVEVTNISLVPSANYFVTYDSTAFEGVNSGLLSTGIYDSLTWTFNTSALALGDFTEDFANCGATALGVFVQQSLSGVATWKCDTFNDTANSFNPPYVVMNGGTGSEVFENEDYLITALPIDFGSLGLDDVRKASLNYQEKRRFGGDKVTRGIFYSKDYAGDAATATWVAIDNNLPAIPSTGQFFDKNIDITSAADEKQPFFLAFKYESTVDTTNNAYEWALDNISVSHTDSTVSINDIFKKQVNLTVLGEATSNNINLRVSTLKNLDLNITIVDLNGRVVYNKAAYVTTGTQIVTLNNTNVAQGMYMIRVSSKEGQQAVKVMVH